MRVIVAGCRSYRNYDEARVFLEQCFKNISCKEEIVLVSGQCQGADELGERFAKEKGWLIEKHPAMWKKYGRAAGPIRNREMVNTCDVVICFWDGKSKGTGSLIRYAKNMGKPVTIQYIIP